jgi:hypothetical protein
MEVSDKKLESVRGRNPSSSEGVSILSRKPPQAELAPQKEELPPPRSRVPEENGQRLDIEA